MGAAPMAPMGVGPMATPMTMQMAMSPMGMGQISMASGMMAPGMMPMMIGAGGAMMSPLMRAPPPQPTVSRVKCVECGQVMEANNIAFHKRECRMRLVSCSQCRYSMRYCQWDNHNRFCNTAGACPLCGKQIKDNLIVHLYEKHTQELLEKGFFQGGEPPVKMR
jgi:hypothetical protein